MQLQLPVANIAARMGLPIRNDAREEMLIDSQIGSEGQKRLAPHLCTDVLSRTI